MSAAAVVVETEEEGGEWLPLALAPAPAGLTYMRLWGAVVSGRVAARRVGSRWVVSLTSARAFAAAERAAVA